MYQRILQPNRQPERVSIESLVRFILEQVPSSEDIIRKLSEHFAVSGRGGGSSTPNSCAGSFILANLFPSFSCGES